MTTCGWSSSAIVRPTTLGIGGEQPAPARVAQHDDRRRTFLVGRNDRPSAGTRRKHGEEVRRHGHDAHRFGLVAAAEDAAVSSTERPRARLERPVLQAPVDESPARNRLQPRPLPAGSTVRTVTRRSGSGNGNGRQQLGIDDGEGRDRRADADGERQDRRGRECRLRPQHPYAVARVAAEICSNDGQRQTSRASSRASVTLPSVRRLAWTASAVGIPDCSSRSCAMRAMELELLGQLGVSPAAIEPVANATKQGGHDCLLMPGSPARQPVCSTRWMATTRRSNSSRSAPSRFRPAAVSV